MYEKYGVGVRFCNLRIAAEWPFGRITQYWRTVAFLPKQKLQLSEVGTWYLLATLLTNCLTCMYRRDPATQYFNVAPPPLHEYLNSTPYVASLGKGYRQPQQAPAAAAAAADVMDV
jgi:hypothetical protein